MSCPHGANSTPLTCSQCIGATPQVVRVEPGNIVTVDGKPLGTLRQLNEAQEARITGHKSLSLGGRAHKGPRHCTRCGQPGHNRLTCGRAPRTDEFGSHGE